MIYKGHTVNNQNELKKAIIANQKRIYIRIKTFKIIFLIFAELVGISALLFSVTTFIGYHDSFPTYERPLYEYYGGDAYSGIQNATVDAANNIAELGDLLKNYIYDFSFTIGGFLLVIGLLILVVATFSIIKTIYSPVVVSKAEIEAIMENELLYFD